MAKSNLTSSSETTESLLDLSVEEMIESLSKMSRNQRCKIHMEQYFYFYCKKCHIPICRDYTVVTHRELNGHRIFELQDMFQVYMTKFNQRKDISSKYIEEMEELIKKHSATISDIKSMKNKLIQTIKIDLKENIKTFQKHADELIKEITIYCEGQQKKIQDNQTKLDETKNQLKSQLDKFVAAKNKLAAVVTFEIYRKMKQNENQNKKILTSSKAIKDEKIQVVFEDDSTFQKCLFSRGKVLQVL